MSEAVREEEAGSPGRGRGARRSRLSGLRRSPDLAAVLAILLPGAGHLYLGRFRAAGGWLAAILVGYWAVFFPGLLLHVISIGAAYRAARTRPTEAGRAVPNGA
jgi:hypothetical protein